MLISPVTALPVIANGPLRTVLPSSGLLRVKPKSIFGRALPCQVIVLTRVALCSLFDIADPSQ
jgi:hypothetical protein